jgi:hypothetical protein
MVFVPRSKISYELRFEINLYARSHNRFCTSVKRTGLVTDEGTFRSESRTKVQKTLYERQLHRDMTRCLGDTPIERYQHTCVTKEVLPSLADIIGE